MVLKLKLDEECFSVKLSPDEWSLLHSATFMLEGSKGLGIMQQDLSHLAST